MKIRLVLVPLLVAAVAALSACGGGGSTSVPADAVAVVGSTPITKAQFNALMTQAQGQAKAAGQPVPTVGTPQYTQLQSRVVAYLVQNAEMQQQASKLGVTVTAKDVTAYLNSLAQLHYGGSQKKLDAAIAKSGLTVPEARQVVFTNLLNQKVQTKVTSAAKVSTAAEKQYYNTNISQYRVPAQTTRSVRHILVSTKSFASKLEQKLKNGANFAALAKKYSKDPGTAQLGGDYTAVKGRDDPNFDKAAFSLKTKQISAPVHSQFGWHIIQALGPVKNTPAHTTPFSKAQATIQQQLLSQQQQTLWGNWLQNLQHQYQGKVRYQTGYAPPPTTAITPTTPAPPPTTTG